MMIWTAPSVRTCFKNALWQKNDSTSITLDAAKGEFVSMQILVRNYCRFDIVNETEIQRKIIHISGWEIIQTEGDKFDVSDVRIQAQEYHFFADGITYPDALSNNCDFDVDINTTRSIWVTIPVPYNQSAGEYKFHVSIESDSDEEIYADIILKVYDVAIPAPDCGEYSVEHFSTPGDSVLLKDAGYTCTPYDEKWWEFMENYAISLKECRSNVYRIAPLSSLKAAGSRRIAEDKWHFDFTYFNKIVDLLNKNGVAKRFALDDIMTSFNGAEVYSIGYNGEEITIDINEPEADMWIKAYFNALYEQILKHSSPDKWILHIQDEPRSARNWIKLRKYADEYMKGLMCGNPIDESAEAELVDAFDLYIPIFHQVEEKLDFYEDVAQNPEKEVWAYCSCAPYSSWYLNRFIDRPSIHARLIAWATYSRGIKGFLHYGYSYWQKTKQFRSFGLDEHAQYKGDCLIIHPSPENNSYKISIRYINLRDGAQDYELLKIIEKTDKEKALKLSRSVAEGYRNFNADEKHFLEVRRNLLETAEKLRKDDKI